MGLLAVTVPYNALTISILQPPLEPNSGPAIVECFSEVLGDMHFVYQQYICPSHVGQNM